VVVRRLILAPRIDGRARYSSGCLLREAGVSYWEQVGNVDDAKRAVEAGADVVIAQGFEAGGHNYQGLADKPGLPTLVLLPTIVDAVGGHAMVLAREASAMAAVSRRRLRSAPTQYRLAPAMVATANGSGVRGRSAAGTRICQYQPTRSFREVAKVVISVYAQAAAPRGRRSVQNVLQPAARSRRGTYLGT
jgi:Nitronate monooxygenase